jgi:pimeloyl-ACP methyl ester carboxylesterase
VYERVDPSTSQSLLSFRQSQPPNQIGEAGAIWEYIATGEGEQAIVFLHGMTGAYDIWWQQIEALKDRYRIISVTYPPVRSLEELEHGLLAILSREKVARFNLVGTSLGGYFAQYLVARRPQMVARAVFANTFPPNDLIAENNRTIGRLLPFLPEWLVISVLRGSFEQSIYPTSGNDALTLAFLNEMGYGRMSKSQVVGRYRCVVQKFESPSPQVPVMILESDNDPLVEAVLREQLKATYPEAIVHTFAGAGHFPYINRPAEYTRMVDDFFSAP